MDENEIFWHGSPSFLEPGDILVPGRELGRDRFSMDRNMTVFMSTDRHTAVTMGASDLDLGTQEDEDNCKYARYVYEVEPIGLYPQDHLGEGIRAPHEHICYGERQAKRAKVLVRHKCLNPNPVQLSTWEFEDAIYVEDA